MEHNHFNDRKPRNQLLANEEGPPIWEKLNFENCEKATVRNWRIEAPQTQNLSRRSSPTRSAPANPNFSHSRWDGLESISLRTAAKSWDRPPRIQIQLGVVKLRQIADFCGSFYATAHVVGTFVFVLPLMSLSLEHLHSWAGKRATTVHLVTLMGCYHFKTYWRWRRQFVILIWMAFMCFWNP